MDYLYITNSETLHNLWTSFCKQPGTKITTPVLKAGELLLNGVDATIQKFSKEGLPSAFSHAMHESFNLGNKTVTHILSSFNGWHPQTAANLISAYPFFQLGNRGFQKTYKALNDIFTSVYPDKPFKSAFKETDLLVNFNDIIKKKPDLVVEPSLNPATNKLADQISKVTPLMVSQAQTNADNALKLATDAQTVATKTQKEGIQAKKDAFIENKNLDKAKKQLAELKKKVNSVQLKDSFKKNILLKNKKIKILQKNSSDAESKVKAFKKKAEEEQVQANIAFTNAQKAKALLQATQTLAQTRIEVPAASAPASDKTVTPEKKEGADKKDPSDSTYEGEFFRIKKMVKTKPPEGQEEWSVLPCTRNVLVNKYAQRNKAVRELTEGLGLLGLGTLGFIDSISKTFETKIPFKTISDAGVVETGYKTLSQVILGTPTAAVASGLGNLVQYPIDLVGGVISDLSKLSPGGYNVGYGASVLGLTYASYRSLKNLKFHWYDFSNKPAPTTVLNDLYYSTLGIASFAGAAFSAYKFATQQ